MANYTVKAGDTWESIAKLFRGTSSEFAQIATANNWANLLPGVSIYIPPVSASTSMFAGSAAPAYSIPASVSGSTSMFVGSAAPQYVPPVSVTKNTIASMGPSGVGNTSYSNWILRGSPMINGVPEYLIGATPQVSPSTQVSPSVGQPFTPTAESVSREAPSQYETEQQRLTREGIAANAAYAATNRISPTASPLLSASGGIQVQKQPPVISPVTPAWEVPFNAPTDYSGLTRVLEAIKIKNYQSDKPNIQNIVVQLSSGFAPEVITGNEALELGRILGRDEQKSVQWMRESGYTFDPKSDTWVYYNFARGGNQTQTKNAMFNQGTSGQPPVSGLPGLPELTLGETNPVASSPGYASGYNSGYAITPTATSNLVDYSNPASPSGWVDYPPADSSWVDYPVDSGYSSAGGRYYGGGGTSYTGRSTSASLSSIVAGNLNFRVASG